MASFSQMQSQMQSQGLALPPEPLVGPSGPRVSTKGSCVDPSGNDPETGDSDMCSLYIEVDPARLVALGRVYEGSTVVHHTPLLSGKVKVGVEEVIDADAPVPVPSDEVSLMGQAIHTFLAWSTHLVKSLSQHLTKTSVRVGNFDIYGFLEPQSIQRPDNYLKGIINSALKGLDDAPKPKSKAPARWIVVKCNRQKGSTECNYYVMHWMSTIILGSFRNNWEAVRLFQTNLIFL
ncbi:hypothetical protein HKD37_06G017142 [Glycine soja]